MKILAPLTDPRDAHPLRDAGADEVYAGFLTAELLERYADSLSLNARALARASLVGEEALDEAVRRCASAGLRLWITFNQPLLDLQVPHAIRLMKRCAEAGVDGLVLRDPALAEAMARGAPGVALDVSCLGVVLNSAAVDFWTALGAERITLPRGLSGEEILALTRRRPATEFSFLAVGDGCPFVNGLCSPMHGSMGPGTPRAGRALLRRIRERLPVVDGLIDRAKALLRARARALRGEFCTGDFTVRWPDAPPGPLRLRHPLWTHDRTCSACRLPAFLERPNLGPAKVAGRIFTLAERLRRTAFCREALTLAEGFREAPQATIREAMEELHRRFWSRPCEGRACYYPFPSSPSTTADAPRPAPGAPPRSGGRPLAPPSGTLALPDGAPPGSGPAVCIMADAPEALPRGLPAGSRVYLGSFGCERLLPDEATLTAWLEALARRELRLTLVTPYLGEEGLDRCANLLSLLETSAADAEIQANDWGLLHMLARSGSSLRRSAGPWLLPQLRGPNMLGRKTALSAVVDADVIEALSRPLVAPELLRPLLARLGVSRLELSTLMIGARAPVGTGLPCSLLAPWVPVTTTRACPFAVTGGGRHPWPGPRNVPCRHECRRGPAPMTGRPSDAPLSWRGNVLVYPCPPPVELPPGFDRLVVAADREA